MSQRYQKDVANFLLRAAWPCDFIFSSVEGFHNDFVNLGGWQLLGWLVLNVLLVDLIHLLLLLVLAYTACKNITESVFIGQHILKPVATLLARRILIGTDIETTVT